MCDVTSVARALIAVGAAFVLFMALLVGVVVLYADEESIAVDNLLAEDLSREVARAERESGGRLDLPALAPFAWDELLIVAPRTPREAISRRLGYEWKGELAFQTGELLIFLDDGRVTRFADYRGEGRFEGFATPIDAVPPDRAVLRVRDLVVSP